MTFLSLKEKHYINKIVCADYFHALPTVIHQYTKFNYSIEQHKGRYYLKPSFHNVPYRNVFLPEIEIITSKNGDHTCLCITGRLVKPIIIFIKFWFGSLFVMELLLLVIAATIGLNNLFPIFLPIIICAFSYLLCKISTKLTFQTVVNVIQKQE